MRGPDDPEPRQPVGTTPKPFPILIQDRHARQEMLTVCVWDDAGFAELLRALADASFSRERIELLRAAAQGTDGFTAAQVAQVLRTLSFSNDRADAVRVLRYRVIDLQPEEPARILAAVDQDSARLEALGSLTHMLRPGAVATPIVAAFDFPRNQAEARRMLRLAGP